MAALVEEYLASMRNAPLAGVHQLMNAGVQIKAIALVCHVPARIDRSGDHYQLAPTGRTAWIAPVAVPDPEIPDLIEASEPAAVIAGKNIIDLVAFSLSAPNKFALRLGQGTVLGAIEPQYCAPAPVPVHRTILNWLRRECRGITLLTKDPIEAGRILRQIRHICVEDLEHKREIVKLCRTLSRMHLPVVQSP
jgi:hypothetical protein